MDNIVHSLPIVNGDLPKPLPRLDLPYVKADDAATAEGISQVLSLPSYAAVTAC
jgi:hypothetical protein